MGSAPNPHAHGPQTERSGHPCAPGARGRWRLCGVEVVAESGRTEVPGWQVAWGGAGARRVCSDFTAAPPISLLLEGTLQSAARTLTCCTRCGQGWVCIVDLTGGSRPGETRGLCPSTSQHCCAVARPRGHTEPSHHARAAGTATAALTTRGPTPCTGPWGSNADAQVFPARSLQGAGVWARRPSRLVTTPGELPRSGRGGLVMPA